MKLISYSGRWFQPLWKIWKSVGMITFPNKNPWFQTTNQVLRYYPPIYFFILDFFYMIHILSMYYPYIIHNINYPYVIYIIPFNFIYTSTMQHFYTGKSQQPRQPRPQDGPWLWHGPLEEQLGHQWRVEDHVRITNGDLKMGSSSGKCEISEISPKIWLG